MSGSAGLSAAKRRRAEQPPTQSQQTQQQPNRQNQPNNAKETPPPRTAPRVMTPMSILEDHELRLRYIESCIKDGLPATENKVIAADTSDSSTSLSSSSATSKKEVEINDSFKNEITVILNRIGELENTNTDLRKKIVGLESDLSSVSNKHSILQTFAMETNASLLKHKDTFEPGVVTRLINILLDKTTVNTDKTTVNTKSVEVSALQEPEPVAALALPEAVAEALPEAVALPESVAIPAEESALVSETTLEKEEEEEKDEETDD